MKLLGRVLSYIFNPLFIPLLAVVLVFNSGSYIAHIPWEVKRAIYLIIGFTSVFLPLLSYGIFYYQKLVSSFDLQNPKQRSLILFFGTLYNFFSWYLLNRLPISQHIQNYMLLFSVLALIFSLISLKWNISIALGGLGALAGLVLAFAMRTQIDLSLVFSTLILVSGIIAYSKLYLNRNTPLQLYSAFILGFGYMLGAVLYL